MKKIKKYVIGFVAAMVFSTGLITAAFASGVIVWGGEGDIAIIRDTLTFLDKKLGTTLTENERLVKELEDERNEESESPNGLAKKNKELREKNEELTTENSSLKETIEALRSQIAQLESDNTILTDELEASEATVAELQASLDASEKLTKTEQDKLAQAIKDVQVLREEAEAIRSKHE